MLKRWFPFSFAEELAPRSGAFRNGSGNCGTAIADPDTEADPAPATSTRSPLASTTPAGAGKFLPFGQIYQGSAVKPPRLPDGILKVATMVNSQHLSGLSPDAKRCSLLMALEAAGVEVEELLQDAVMRQKALNDYEEAHRNRLHEFE